MSTALASTPRDLALAAIETELESALLTSQIIARVLYYTPHAGHYDGVASTVQAWARKHDFVVTHFCDDVMHTFVVADAEHRQIVKVFKMLSKEQT